MQLINVGLARSIWLFDINDLNPTGKSIFPEILVWLGEKYKFQIFPKSLSDLDKEKKGYIFTAGEFQTDENSVTVNLSIFSDGIVAETWASTEKSDVFVEEILRSAATKYGLAVQPDTIRKKQYISEVTVRLDHHLNNLNPKITSFCDRINKFFVRHNLPPFEITGMAFAPDTSASAYKPPGLLIERKMGVPFTENRFWSKSPFATKDHLLALEEFETLLADLSTSGPR
jgi:hypothetical protein